MSWIDVDVQLQAPAYTGGTSGKGIGVLVPTSFVSTLSASLVLPIHTTMTLSDSSSSEDFSGVYRQSIRLDGVLVLAFYSSDETEESKWRPYLMFGSSELPFLLPYGAKKVGFFVHAMICALGVWGHLEKADKNGIWTTLRNGEDVVTPALYRFRAELNSMCFLRVRPVLNTDDVK